MRKLSESHRKALEPTQFKPGQSGNPKGRQKGIVGHIKSLTNNAFECADFMYQVMKGNKIDGLDKKPGLFYRMEAAKWLTQQAYGSNPAVTSNPDQGEYDIQQVLFITMKKRMQMDPDIVETDAIDT